MIHSFLSAANHTFVGLSVWAWIAIVLFVAILAFYFIGSKVDRKQAGDFRRRLTEDIATLVRPVYAGSRADLERAAANILAHDATADLGPAVRSVTVDLEEQTGGAVQVTVAAVVDDPSGKRVRKTAVRVYDREFLPTDVSGELLRAGGKSAAWQLYPATAPAVK